MDAGPAMALLSSELPSEIRWVKLFLSDELMWFCSWEINQWIFEVRQENKKKIVNQLAYIIAIPRDMLQKDHKNDFRWMGKIIIL